MDEVNQKKVDENWKNQVETEKSKAKEEGKFVPPDADFKFFVTTLAMQSSIALGHMPNPATDKKEKDFTQAKFLIDTLGMLQEKTKGNLDAEESGLLENLLFELRTEYLRQKTSFRPHLDSPIKGEETL